MRIETLCSIFPEQNRETIEKLIEDEDFLRHLPSLISRRIKESKGVVLVDKEILMLLFSEANFAGDEEKIRMSYLFRRSFYYQGRFLPLAVDFLNKIAELKQKRNLTERNYRILGEDFASRCLFSLSFFYNALEKLYSHYGAPHPEFYREFGKRTFYSIGETGISKNFDNWENYLRENFAKN